MKEYPPTGALVFSLPVGEKLHCQPFYSALYWLCFHIIWQQLSALPPPPHTPWENTHNCLYKKLRPPQELAISAENSDCPNSCLGTTSNSRRASKGDWLFIKFPSCLPVCSWAFTSCRPCERHNSHLRRRHVVWCLLEQAFSKVTCKIRL